MATPAIEPSTIIDINRCIYCNGIGETDEHVLPYALGGRVVLRKASCEPCRDITSRCERNPLSEIWFETRAYLDFPSRKRKFEREVFPLKAELKDGTATVLKLNKDEILGLTPFLELRLPGFFTGNDHTKGSTVCGLTTIAFGDVQSLTEKYNLKSITHSFLYKGNHFERMIAGIAYRCVIASWGLDCFAEKFILPALLEREDDIGFWVGCDPDGKIIPNIGKNVGLSGSFALKLGIWTRGSSDQKIITARLKFFVASDAPEYIVIVGRLKDGLALI